MFFLFPHHLTNFQHSDNTCVFFWQILDDHRLNDFIFWRIGIIIQVTEIENIKKN